MGFTDPSFWQPVLRWDLPPPCHPPLHSRPPPLGMFTFPLMRRPPSLVFILTIVGHSSSQLTAFTRLCVAPTPHTINALDLDPHPHVRTMADPHPHAATAAAANTALTADAPADAAAATPDAAAAAAAAAALQKQITELEEQILHLKSANNVHVAASALGHLSRYGAPAGNSLPAANRPPEPNSPTGRSRPGGRKHRRRLLRRRHIYRHW